MRRLRILVVFKSADRSVKAGLRAATIVRLLLEAVPDIIKRIEPTAAPPAQSRKVLRIRHLHRLLVARRRLLLHLLVIERRAKIAHRGSTISIDQQFLMLLLIVAQEYHVEAEGQLLILGLILTARDVDIHGSLTIAIRRRQVTIYNTTRTRSLPNLQLLT